MGSRAQEQGKDRVAALTVWTLHLPGVSFRCLSAGERERCLLHVKKGAGGWKLHRLAGTSGELLASVTKTVIPLLGQS